MSKRFIIICVCFALLAAFAQSAIAQCACCAKAPNAPDAQPKAKCSCSAKAIGTGNGFSLSTDPQKAGAEAARKAKKALCCTEPKVVIVFDSVAANPAAKKELLAGVASVFDASIIYGCSAYDAITQDTNKAKVAVLALGGDMRIKSAVAHVEDGHETCGKRIGESLKAAAAKKAKGKFMILFGSCHVPADDEVVKGVASVVGEKFPIAGGAASGGEFLYYKGKVTDKKSNLGLLLTGNFKCGFSTLKEDGAEGVINSAKKAFTNAVGADKDDLVMMFAFDCGGRRGSLGDNLPRELEAMKDVVGDTPIFGFYGSGEIGPKDNDSPSRGVGYHISACAISTK